MPTTNTNDTNVMLERLKKAFTNSAVYIKVLEDFTRTFQSLGLDPATAGGLSEHIITMVRNSDDLPAAEDQIHNKLLKMIFVGKKPLLDVLKEKLLNRAEIISQQVIPYLKDFTGGRFVDFGAGDGQVTQLVWCETDFNEVVGYDVCSYVAPNIIVPIYQFDGKHLSVSRGHFCAGLMTNVAHHEQNNQQILDELARVIAPGGTLVVIETVPMTDSPDDFEVTFANDYLYNRIFHLSDIPVPGTYETFDGWIRRFKDVGFVLKYKPIDLGIDQEVIRDRHALYVFTRKD